MSEAYRVGIIGCGGMGRSHARQWTQKSKTCVVAVADINEGNAGQLADEFGANMYAEYEKMLEDE